MWFSPIQRPEVVFAFQKLYVTDATGQELPSLMEWADEAFSETGSVWQFALVIKDEEKVYPVGVYPTLVSVGVTEWNSYYPRKSLLRMGRMSLL